MTAKLLFSWCPYCIPMQQRLVRPAVAYKSRGNMVSLCVLTLSWPVLCGDDCSILHMCLLVYVVLFWQQHSKLSPQGLFRV
jgi:hypothetical protein